MAIHSLSQVMLTKSAFDPAAFTAGTQNGNSIDLQGVSGQPYRRACFIVNFNTGAATTANYNLQESADNSTWTSVSGATLGTAQSASTKAVYMVDVDLAKRQRYLRMQVIGTGTAGAGSVELVLFEGNYLAPTQDNTPTLV